MQDYTFYSAHIYGNLKIHKIGNPIRSNIADFENLLKYIEKFLKIILGHYINKELILTIGLLGWIIHPCILILT